jgi:ABC transporter substrate binding protein (PQQ-dependent alcohol dehydrogenase system)
MKFLLLSFILLSFVKAELLNVNILYLEQKIQKPPVLSNVIADPDDLGIKGAELSIKDSNKSAKFLNQNFTLEKTISFDKKELITSFEKFINEGNSFVILNVEDDFLKELLNNPLSKKALLFNASSQTTSLRQDYCQQNLLHTTPSNAMLYDGLAQFLVKRNFKDIFLLSGKNPKDVEITKNIKRAVKKFGLKIVKEKVWENNTDIRRKAGAEFPSFTQADDYDVLVVADYYGDFGEFLYFNTWLPRPIAGTQGLKPVLWHRVIEAWGAAQMQKRFEKFASRWMQSNDFSNWLAVRTIVNSVMNTKAKDLNTNMNYIHSKDFELGAYLGRKVSFRDYNGQIRLPISLVQPRALISTSPQVGFLHPVTDLDTLGIAPFEMKCKN